MINRLVFTVILFIFTLLPLTLSAAKEVEIAGNCVYVLPADMSESEGRDIAVSRAISQALADRFGTFISSEIWTDITNDSGVSSVSLRQLGNSLVRGEWIRHLNEPNIKKSISADGSTVIEASVRGLAREVANNFVDLKAYLSSPSVDYEQNRYKDGERFTLHFKSPVKGFLSVFLADENDDVCRLLPFSADAASHVNVDPMQPYDFFTSQRGIEEQYMFQTLKSRERNVVYLIFSPNDFIRPLDTYYESRNLRILKAGEFFDWLARVKSFDPDLQVRTIPVEIFKR